MTNTQADFYTPQPEWMVQQHGYWPGHTYMINGYRMYLHGSGYFYFVDYPEASPLRAARPHYRTGGVPGAFLKIVGVLSLIAGIGMMFGEETGFILAGAFLITIGLFGTALALYDSMRNHSAAWKVGATVAVAAYAIHSLTDDDR